jgi:hypothetical protein
MGRKDESNSVLLDRKKGSGITLSKTDTREKGIVWSKGEKKLNIMNVWYADP